MNTLIPFSSMALRGFSDQACWLIAELAEGAQTGNESGWVVSTVMVMLSIAFLFAVVRTIKGPTLPDRVISLDLMAYFIISAIGVYSIITDKPTLIMIAIVMGLILFLGTTAFALYLERRARP